MKIPHGSGEPKTPLKKNSFTNKPKPCRPSDPESLILDRSHFCDLALPQVTAACHCELSLNSVVSGVGCSCYPYVWHVWLDLRSASGAQNGCPHHVLDLSFAG